MDKTPHHLTRRGALRIAGTTALGVTLADWTSLTHALASADDGGLEPFNRFPRMVHNYYLDQVTRAERRGLRIKEALETKEEAEAYVKEVQKKIRACFAPFPQKRTPLKPRITGTVERDEYRIENIIFESRPGFLVTANLYLPKNREFPLPGVVGTCGHSANGKAAEAYQAFGQGLARLGYVVLVYDPIGQGERLQYLDETMKPSLRGATREHALAGNQQFLIGQFFGTWRAWDGMRALDYLLTRKEVDPAHLGVTGNSGGGTMTTWLCGVEPRWTMAAPSCFVTTWRRNMENEIPQDTEQCPPRSLAMALDHDDYLTAQAPDPVIILPKEKDYFDVRGSEEALGRLKHLYKLLGAEENVDLFAGPTNHGFTQENREAMYRWFNRATGVSDAQTEPELTIEKDETLWCTPNGQVRELESRTVFSFTSATAKAMAKGREPLDAESLKKAVAAILKLPPREGPPRVRNLKAAGGDRKYPEKYFMNYAVETEPGIQAICAMLTKENWFSRPPRAAGKGRAIFYISHHSADAELRGEPLVREVIAKEGEDIPVFACDVRGVGDSQPGTTGKDAHDYYGPDYFYAIYALMLNRPYLGGKTHDILCVLDMLAEYGHKEVHLVAKGWGALPATFAALLSARVAQVTLKNALTSYADVATTEHYTWPLSTFLPGVLKTFDLPDCYRVLESKKLRQIEPLDAASQPA